MGAPFAFPVPVCQIRSDLVSFAQNPSFLVPLACPIRRPPSSAHNAAHKPSHRPAPTCSQAPKTAHKHKEERNGAPGRRPQHRRPQAQEDACNAHKRPQAQTAQNSPQVPARKNSRIKTTTLREHRPQRPARTPLTCEYLRPFDRLMDKVSRVGVGPF